MTIGPRTGIGARQQLVQLQNPGAPVPNGDGSYTQMWSDLDPFAVWAKIETAPQPQQERATQGTAATTAAYLITIPFHPQVTERTRVLFSGRRFNVSAAVDLNERHVETVLACEEMK